MRTVVSISVVSAVALGSIIGGASAAPTRSASAAAGPQQKVTASLLKRPSGTLAPGTTVPASEIYGNRVFIDANRGYAEVSREVVEDVRPVIRRITVCDGRSAAGRPTVVEMEMSTQPRGAKPGEVLAAIGDFIDVRARRTNQWIERDGARQEPLDADTRPRVPEACVS